MGIAGLRKKGLDYSCQSPVFSSSDFSVIATNDATRGQIDDGNAYSKSEWTFYV